MSDAQVEIFDDETLWIDIGQLPLALASSLITVEGLIFEATSDDNLKKMFYGWQPYL